MTTWYKKADNLGSETYTANIKVSMYGLSDYDIEATSQVEVKFSIDVEARSWGINHIGIGINGSIQVPYEFSSWSEHEDTRKQGSVNVDLEQLTREVQSGAGIVTVGNLELWLNDQFDVDYDKSSLTIYTY